MSTVEKTIDVDQDVRTVYNQWTQFEDFPQFMEGVESVKQLDDATLEWKADIGMAEREWTAEIVEQVPDKVIEWRATGDTQHSGRVEFEPLEGGRTRVKLTMDYEPQNVTEKAGDALNIVDKRTEGDMKRFKEFIEQPGTETGAWRGEIR